VRAQVIAALEGLRAPSDWLEELRKSEPVVVHQSWIPSPDRSFRPPDFHRYEESPEEWIARSLAKIRLDLEDQMDQWQAWERAGVDEPVARPKQRRVTGRNSRFEDRMIWAAEWLMGRSWKDIAIQYLQPGSEPEVQKAADRVSHSANEILQIAGFTESDRLPAFLARKTGNKNGPR
jgi:hypothetical protein